ncbi:MAG: hypothetical protein V7L25_28020 [Nostoc sp.]|uniref:hypothetical protein n=1 Tax=Nostoc sp. TaxID=1180 RepID=UPI002FF2338A
MFIRDAPFVDPFADKSWAESLGLGLVSVEFSVKRRLLLFLRVIVGSDRQQRLI